MEFWILATRTFWLREKRHTHTTRVRLIHLWSYISILLELNRVDVFTDFLAAHKKLCDPVFSKYMCVGLVLVFSYEWYGVGKVGSLFVAALNTSF